MCHELPHSGVVSRSEHLGDRNGVAAADAHAEAKDHEVDRAGGAHACQGVFAQQPADDDGVDQVVELLEQEAK